MEPPRQNDCPGLQAARQAVFTVVVSGLCAQKGCAQGIGCFTHPHADRRAEPYSNTVSVHTCTLLSFQKIKIKYIILRQGTFLWLPAGTRLLYSIPFVCAGQAVKRWIQSRGLIHSALPDTAAPPSSRAPHSMASDYHQKTGLVRKRTGQVPPCASYCTCQMSLLYSSIVRSEEK